MEQEKSVSKGRSTAIGCGVIFVLVAVIALIGSWTEQRQLKKSQEKQQAIAGGFNKLVEEGRELVNRGDYDTALQRFTEAVKMADTGYKGPIEDANRCKVAVHALKGDTEDVDAFIRSNLANIKDGGLKGFLESGTIPSPLDLGHEEANAKLVEILQPIAGQELSSRMERRKKKAEARKRDEMEWEFYYEARLVIGDPNNADWTEKDENKYFSKIGKKYGVSGDEASTIYTRREFKRQKIFKTQLPNIKTQVKGIEIHSKIINIETITPVVNGISIKIMPPGGAINRPLIESDTFALLGLFLKVPAAERILVWTVGYPNYSQEGPQVKLYQVDVRRQEFESALKANLTIGQALQYFQPYIHQLVGQKKGLD